MRAGEEAQLSGEGAVSLLRFSLKCDKIGMQFIPACFFSKEGEKRHGRSFEALFRDKGLLRDGKGETSDSE